MWFMPNLGTLESVYFKNAMKIVCIICYLMLKAFLISQEWIHTLHCCKCSCHKRHGMIFKHV